jgi:hypothetical protein
MNKKTALIPMIVIFILTLTFGNTVYANGTCQELPTIELIAHYAEDATTYTFVYEITAGKRDVTKWQLWSPCFTKDKVILYTEQNLNPAQHYIHMEHKVKACQSYTFYITLKNGDYYAGCNLGKINTKIWAGPDHPESQVDGPVPLSPNFIVSENMTGTIGIIISMISAMGLVFASRKF